MSNVELILTLTFIAVYIFGIINGMQIKEYHIRKQKKRS